MVSAYIPLQMVIFSFTIPSGLCDDLDLRLDTLLRLSRVGRLEVRLRRTALAIVFFLYYYKGASANA